MTIVLNGKPETVSVATLAELCAALGYDANAKIATAVNGAFVPLSARADHKLNRDDKVEIVSPRQGG